MATSTITMAGAHGMQRGMQLTIGGSTQLDGPCWVVRVVSATEIEIASSWRDSWWVIWFRLLDWWKTFSRRFAMTPWSRHNFDRGEQVWSEKSGPVLVAPADDSAEVLGEDLSDAENDTLRQAGGIKRILH